MKSSSPKLTCDIENVKKSLATTGQPVAALSSAISQLRSAILKIFPIWREITKNSLHLHSKHYHTVSKNNMHPVGDKTTTGNACITSSSKGNIDTLMSEQNSFTDLNQTGMIFGRDYAFENHIDLPRFFKSMHNPAVNQYSQEMLSSIQTYQKFLDKTLRDLYLDKTTCASDKSGLTAEKALTLEFFKGSDFDDDGLVYGNDFFIDGKDTPTLILELNRVNDINKNSNILPITWNEYLEKQKQILIKNPTDMSICQISPFTKNELIDELIDEFLTCRDQNNDGLIYGKDFIIVGDSKPNQLNQYVPLYLPNIITTWTSYAKQREYNQPNNLLKYVNLLKDEYSQNKDIDGNGLIFGVDFILDNLEFFDDLEFLDIINQHSELTKLTIRAYNNTISPYVENYVLDENIQAAKFNAEWRDKVDVDGNGLIYGLDFILSDYEENKTECLWNIEKFQRFTLSWTPEKVSALKLNTMISDYTQFEFDQYWACSESDTDDGPSVPDDPIIPPPDDFPGLNLTCNPDMKPIIPLDYNAYDLSDHYMLFNGEYWFDLGTNDVNYYSGTFMVPDGTMITLSNLQINHIFDTFTDSSIYYIKTLTQYTSDNPYVFKINIDNRKRIYPSERFFSVVDECLILNDVAISNIILLTESKNYIIISDTRSDKTVPFDKADLTNYMLRWIYDNETETGKFILSNHYETLLNRVIILDTVKSSCGICVPLYKQSIEFKHFLPFILNVSWNDI